MSIDKVFIYTYFCIKQAYFAQSHVRVDVYILNRLDISF